MQVFNVLIDDTQKSICANPDAIGISGLFGVKWTSLQEFAHTDDSIKRSPELMADLIAGNDVRFEIGIGG